jgi:hypothetical protein
MTSCDGAGSWGCGSESSLCSEAGDGCCFDCLLISYDSLMLVVMTLLYAALLEIVSSKSMMG